MNQNSGRIIGDAPICPTCGMRTTHFNAMQDREGAILHYGGEECECGYLEIGGRHIQDGDDDPQGA